MKYRNMFLLLVTASLVIIGVHQSYSTQNPIQHIVVILQENRSFDNYFGTFPGANGIPPNTCVPVSLTNPAKGCVHPYLATTFTNHDLPHNAVSSVQSINDGLMNGFMVGERNDSHTMEYYDNSLIPHYWTFAKNYVLADNFFSSALSYSIPNHWYVVAGQAPPISMTSIIPSGTAEDKAEYLAEANEIPTIADTFVNVKTITWKYYDTTLALNGYNKAKQTGEVYSWWNPFKAKTSSYTTNYYKHFDNAANFFSDVTGNSLPQVSWVIAPSYADEHSPSSVLVGQVWSTKVIDAVMNSPNWSSTAIILTWDDYGGFYDHVNPPSVDNQGSSIRVPLLVISPYSKTNFIDHTRYTGFESILKFIEWRFNLPSLTPRDTDAVNMLNAFDFTQQPKLPKPVPLTANELATLNSMYLKPSSGPPGTAVTVVGNGFSFNEPGIKVLLDGQQVRVVTSNSTGSFVTTVNIPAGSDLGCQKIAYKGPDTQSAQICFTVTH
jgi:phospholipase C